MTEENFECEQCGKTFDSRRGLSVHQSQMHDDQESSESEEKTSESHSGSETGSQNTNSRSDTISLGVRHVMIGVFILGLTVGFSTGLAASNFQALTGALDSGDQTSSDSGEPTIEVMANIADDMNIDSNQMREYVQSSNGQEIQRDKTEIQRAAGAIGTPTFFIGNSEIGYAEISGAMPYSRMKPVIDEKLVEAENGSKSIGEDEYTLENVSFNGEPTMGDETAPINIIEYSDFGCPWCAEWHGVDAIPQRPIEREQSFTQVRNNYVETGDVQFVAKDYPVPRLHPEALTAHKAANYVWENHPDQYWEFSQAIYQERDRW